MSVVDKNIELMLGDGECSMKALLLKESIAGNAGSVEFEGKTYPCAAANFYYDEGTGEMLCFTNYPGSEYEGRPQGTFRLAMNLEGKGFLACYFRVVDAFLDESLTEANRVLGKTIARYNALGGEERE